MWATADTETRSGGAFRLGAAMLDTGEKLVFHTADEMRDWIARSGRTIYAHNASYDVSVLWGGALTVRSMRGRYRSATLPARLTGRRRVRILDTFNFFEQSLASLGQQLGLPKLADSSLVDLMSDRDLGEHCLRDCEIARLAVERVHRVAADLGVSPFATGPGAWAREYFELTSPGMSTYPDDRSHPPPDGVVRGGRVSHRVCRLKGGEKWDIRSAYPHIMRSSDFPDIRWLDRSRTGRVALVGWLPEDGDGSHVWGCPEEAELLGVSPRVVRVLRCPDRSWGRPFGRFVDSLMDWRARYRSEGREPEVGLVKRVANALAGVLGARTQVSYVRSGLVSGGRRAARGLPGSRSVWCALVTSRQRARLMRAWNAAEVPVYSDTDSLICRRYTPDGEGDETVGAWIREAEVEEAIILAPKVYLVRRRRDGVEAHVKGVPRSRAASVIDSYLTGGDTVCEWDSVVSYREAFGADSLWIKRLRDPMRGLREKIESIPEV